MVVVGQTFLAAAKETCGYSEYIDNFGATVTTCLWSITSHDKDTSEFRSTKIKKLFVLPLQFYFSPAN